MRAFLRQLWAISGVFFSMINMGMSLSYSSCLMPALKAKNAEIHTDLETASWIASSIGVGCFPGYILSPYIMNKFGRRFAFGTFILPAIIGWLFIYFANDTTDILIGRLFSGTTVGGTLILGAVITGEYTSPKYRGMFLNLKTAAACIGGMVVHIAGNYCTWRTVSLMSLVPNVIAILIILTWPESPAWLAANGKYEKSKKAFLWLREKDGESMNELKELIQAQMKICENVKPKSTRHLIKDFFKKFTKKNFLMPVFVIAMGGTLLEVAGRHIFPANALDIMEQITGNKNKSFYFTLSLDLLITISAVLSSILVKIMRRRQLLFLTGFIAIAVLAVACLYLFLVAKGLISANYTSIPVVLFALFLILVNLGCIPLPLVFLGELLPLEHRGVGCTVSCCLMAISLNLCLYLTPILLVYCKVYGTFTIYGASMLIILLIMYFCVPETKDKTLQEIEDYFNGATNKNDDGAEEQLKIIKETDLQQP